MSDGLEGLTSTAAVYQSERREILTDWRSIAEQLASALSISHIPGHAPAKQAALDRYQAAVDNVKPEPLPMGPATHEVTYWAWSGDRKTETATSEPRRFSRPAKVRKKQGNRFAMVEGEAIFFEWRRPEGGVNECRADRLLVVKPIESKKRLTDAERVSDDEIFEGLTGEHVSVPEGRPWAILNVKADPQPQFLAVLDESGPIDEPTFEILKRLRADHAKRPLETISTSPEVPKVRDLLADLEASIVRARQDRKDPGR